MNWDNQDNKDPWGNRSNGNDQDFDDLLKRFSSILGGKSGGGKGSSSGGGFNFSPSRFLGYGFFILAVVYLSASIYTVQPGERVVILRLGEYHKETTEGLNFMLFGIDQRFKEDVALTRRYSQTANMLTQDENLVDVTVSVQYRISNIKDFVLNVRDPEASLRKATESALRFVVGDNSLEQALTVGREKIAQDVGERLQEYLDIYQAGLIVQQVNIEKTDPPVAVKAAFDDVVAAREDKIRLQNEAERYALTIVPEARGQAEATIKAAEAYKEQVILTAEGEVVRFNEVYDEYKKNPEVVRKRIHLDAMKKVYSDSTKIMIDVNEGSNITLLPLGDILQQTQDEDED